MIWLLEEITNNSNKYCIFGLTFQSPLSKCDNGLWKVSPNIQYLLELFVISSNNQIMYKLLFILFIIKLYARINIFRKFYVLYFLGFAKFAWTKGILSHNWEQEKDRLSWLCFFASVMSQRHINFYQAKTFLFYVNVHHI